MIKESPMRSRDKALQSLYEIEIKNENAYLQIGPRDQRGIFCERLIRGVIDNMDAIDKILVSYIDRSISSLDIIEKNILRIGLYETLFVKEVDIPIIINEAVRLSKKYGATEGFKYVNAILDKIVKAEGLKIHNSQK